MGGGRPAAEPAEIDHVSRRTCFAALMLLMLLMLMLMVVLVFEYDRTGLVPRVPSQAFRENPATLRTAGKAMFLRW